MKSNKPLAKVFHAEIQGKRSEKYEYLLNNSIASVQWQQLDYKAPYHFFVPKDFNEEKEYELGFKLDEIFKNLNSGVKTDRDGLFIDFNKTNLIERFTILLSYNYSFEFKMKYRIADSGSYKLTDKIKKVKFHDKYIVPFQYRPFDYQFIYYDPNLISRPGYQVMAHIINHKNTSLVSKRGQDFNSAPIFISEVISDIRVYSCPGVQGSDYIFPLYLYPDAEKDGMYANAERTPNLNMEIVNKIAEGLGLEFVPEKLDTVGTGRDLSLQDGNSSVQTTFAPIDILDYIYAVLHSPTYRETYKEFLKIDFPRVPYPHSLGTGRDLSLQKFWKLVQLGGEIRQIHLLESPIVEDYITEYPEDGTNEVEKIKYEGGKVYINSTQYFDNVPEVAWNFYIGGYQPAQKWLKDRKGRTLNFDDILHYQKIIVALTETDRLMKSVDEVMKGEGE